MKSIASLVATIIHNPVSGSYEFSSDFDHRYDACELLLYNICLNRDIINTCTLYYIA